MDLSRHLWQTSQAWSIVAVPVAVLSLLLWLTLLRRRTKILPPQRHRFCPWTALEVIFLFLLSGLIVVAAHEIGRIFVGKSSWTIIGKSPPELPGLTAVELFGSYLFAVPVFFMLSFVVLRLANETRCYQLGIHAARWRQNVFLALLLWLVTTPAILLVNLLVAWLVTRLGQSPAPHGLTEVVTGARPLLEWSILLLCALVAAPLLEEFLFRGLVQRWAGKQIGYAHVLVIAALIWLMMNNWQYRNACGLLLVLFALVYLLCPMFFRSSNEVAPMTADPPDLPTYPTTPHDDTLSDEMRLLIEPYQAFCDKWIPILDLNGRKTGANHARAIIATAVLFAGSHPWPSPAPLFLFGLVLGWLAYRTQSLVGPIVLHFFFNAVACVELAMELQRTAVQ